MENYTDALIKDIQAVNNNDAIALGILKFSNGRQINFNAKGRVPFINADSLDVFNDKKYQVPGIYIFRNNITNEYYIGKAERSLSSRIKEHLNTPDLANDSHRLHAAILKYYVSFKNKNEKEKYYNNFVKSGYYNLLKENKQQEKIDELSSFFKTSLNQSNAFAVGILFSRISGSVNIIDILNQKEKYWIAELQKSGVQEYNDTAGGDGGSMPIFDRETFKKIIYDLQYTKKSFSEIWEEYIKPISKASSVKEMSNIIRRINQGDCVYYNTLKINERPKFTEIDGIRYIRTPEEISKYAKEANHRQANSEAIIKYADIDGKEPLEYFDSAGKAFGNSRGDKMPMLRSGIKLVKFNNYYYGLASNDPKAAEKLKKQNLIRNSDNNIS